MSKALEKFKLANNVEKNARRLNELRMYLRGFKEGGGKLKLPTGSLPEEGRDETDEALQMAESLVRDYARNLFKDPDVQKLTQEQPPKRRSPRRRLTRRTSTGGCSGGTPAIREWLKYEYKVSPPRPPPTV